MEGKASFHSGQARTDLLIQAERALARRTRPWGGPRSAAVLMIGLTAAAALALMPAELALADEDHVLWQIASYPPAGVIRNLMRDSHPPLYYLLAQGWLALGGFDHPWAFRVLSLFLGLPALPLAFQIGRRLGGLRLGLSALVLLALNPWFLFLLILIRMYGLTATLGAWGVWIVLRLLDRPTPRRWAAWTLAQGLLLFTHYYGALLIAALWLTLLRRRPRGWPQGLLASTPAAALFALWLREAYAGSIEHTVQQLSRIPVPPGARGGGVALWGHRPDGSLRRWGFRPRGLPGPSPWASSSPSWSRRPRLRRLSSGGGELAVWVGLPLLLGALMALRWPFFAARYFAMLTVPGAVALAAALHRLRLRAWIPMILILGLIGLSRFPIMAAQPLGLSGFDDLGPALAGLNRSDPILAQARWHIDAAGLFYRYTDLAHLFYNYKWYEWPDPEQRTAIIENSSSFWFVGVTIYQDFWRSWLESLQATHFIDFAATYPHPTPEYGASLFHLVRKPQTAPWQPTAARWQNGLTLTAIALPDSHLLPGSSLRVGLRLHTDRPIPDRWTLFLHLLDPQGHWLAGWDAEPNPPTPAWTPGMPITYWHGLRLPMNLPAGRYTLALGWYPTGSTGTPRLPLQHPPGRCPPHRHRRHPPPPPSPPLGHPVCPRAPARTPSPSRPPPGRPAGDHPPVDHPELAAPAGPRGPCRPPGHPDPPQRPDPPLRPPDADSPRPPDRTRVDPRCLAPRAPDPTPRPGLAGGPLRPPPPRPSTRLAASTPHPVEL
jgi:hypothetical protein